MATPLGQSAAGSFPAPGSDAESQASEQDFPSISPESVKVSCGFCYATLQLLVQLIPLVGLGIATSTMGIIGYHKGMALINSRTFKILSITTGFMALSFGLTGIMAAGCFGMLNDSRYISNRHIYKSLFAFNLVVTLIGITMITLGSLALRNPKAVSGKTLAAFETFKTYGVTAGSASLVLILGIVASVASKKREPVLVIYKNLHVGDPIAVLLRANYPGQEEVRFSSDKQLTKELKVESIIQTAIKQAEPDKLIVKKIKKEMRKKGIPPPSSDNILAKIRALRPEREDSPSAPILPPGLLAQVGLDID